jgi:hypothetical protein
MLSNRGVRIAIGTLLSLVILSGLALASGREYVRHSYRHVVVRVFNVGSTVQLFVNCEQVAVVTPAESGKVVDMGWRAPGDRIFLSATSHDHNPSWGFIATSNGRAFFEAVRGHADLPGAPAEAHAVVFARGFTADGHRLGSVGCQKPGVVAVADYIQSPDDAEVAAVLGDDPPYRPPHPLFGRLDALGGWSLATLALLGCAAACASKTFRRLLWAHKWGVVAIAGILLPIASALGVNVLDALTVAGVLLLAAASARLLLGLEGAAGAGRAEG